MARRNLILAALPDPEFRRLLAKAEPVDLERRTVLHDQSERLEDVYFPLDGIVSLVVSVGDSDPVECATVGREGMVGLPVFLGAATLPMRSVVQISGQAIRLDADAMRDHLASGDGSLQVMLQRYTQTVFTQLAQNVACDRLHSTRQRAARWLLTTADRVGRETFDLTHEFLAQMLGVRRATVTEVAGALADGGAIAYNRGSLSIVDRSALERETCPCYAVVRDVMDRMVGQPEADAAAPETPPPDPR